MTNESLRALCLAAQAKTWWNAYQFIKQCGNEGADYIAAMDPTTTLALLDRIAELEQLLELSGEPLKGSPELLPEQMHGAHKG